MSEDGWDAEGFQNNLATSKLFAGVVEGAEVDDVASEDVDADVLEDGAVVGEVVGGVDDVEARPGEAVDVDVAVVISRGECLDGAADGPDFPFISDGVVGLVAGRDPNDLTLSFLTTGVAVGDDETGAEASSIEPKFKEDPERSVNVW